MRFLPLGYGGGHCLRLPRVVPWVLLSAWLLSLDPACWLLLVLELLVCSSGGLPASGGLSVVCGPLVLAWSALLCQWGVCWFPISCCPILWSSWVLHLQFRLGVSVSCGHTTLKAPALVCFPTFCNIRPGSFLVGTLPETAGCCKLQCFLCSPGLWAVLWFGLGFALFGSMVGQWSPAPASPVSGWLGAVLWSCSIRGFKARSEGLKVPGGAVPVSRRARS